MNGLDFGTPSGPVKTRCCGSSLSGCTGVTPVVGDIDVLGCGGGERFWELNQGDRLHFECHVGVYHIVLECAIIAWLSQMK